MLAEVQFASPLYSSTRGMLKPVYPNTKLSDAEVPPKPTTDTPTMFPFTIQLNAPVGSGLSLVQLSTFAVATWPAEEIIAPQRSVLMIVTAWPMTTDATFDVVHTAL